MVIIQHPLAQMRFELTNTHCSNKTLYNHILVAVPFDKALMNLAKKFRAHRKLSTIIENALTLIEHINFLFSKILPLGYFLLMADGTILLVYV